MLSLCKPSKAALIALHNSTAPPIMPLCAGARASSIPGPNMSQLSGNSGSSTGGKGESSCSRKCGLYVKQC